MCLLRRHCAPFRFVQCALLLGALGSALAGCATTPAGYEPPSSVAYARIETEDLPPQVLSNDPAESSGRTYRPWSPAGQASALRHLSSLEAEAVIARAIAEHEMRRP